MRITAQTILQRFAALQKPGAAELTLVVIALSVLILPQWWALERDRNARREEVLASIELALDSADAALNAWSERLEHDLEAAIRREDLLAAASDALESRPEAEPRLRELLQSLSLGTRGVRVVDYAVTDEIGEAVTSGASQAARYRLPAPAANDSLTPLLAGWNTVADAAGLEAWSLAALFPLQTSARDGWLILRLEARPAIEAVIAERGRPSGPKLFTWSLSGGWIDQESPDRLPCSYPSPEPSDRKQQTSATCEEEGDALASWRSIERLGLSVLAQVRIDDAFQRYSTARTSIGIFAAVMGALLLLGAWLQTGPAKPTIGEIQGSNRNTAAWGILAVSILATGLGWLSAKVRFDEYRVSRFESDAQELSERILGRLEQYARGLSSAGAFAAAENGSPEGWETFVLSLNLPADYPAFECLALVRPEVSPRNAFPRVRSVGPEKCSDDATTRSLRSLADSATKQGSVGASVWRADGATAEHRLVLTLRPAGSREKLYGVMSPSRLLSGLTSQDSLLEFELYAGGPDPVNAAPVFSSATRTGDDSDQTTITFEFAGAEWLVVSSRARVSPAIAENYPAQILLAGLAISVLLFDIALVLSSTRSRAQGIAQLMTKRFRDSEERIRAVIDHAPDGIVTFASNGTIQTFNPSAEKLFGYSSEQAARLPIDQLLPICRPGKARRMEEFAAEGGRSCVGVRSDGSEFPAELTVSSMQIEDRTLYAAIVRDVSIRRQTEERLRESEERYALAARGANDGLWDWNLKTDEVYFSERWKEIIGFEGEAITRRPDEWFERVHPEDLAGLKATLNDHLEARTEFFESEYRIRHANGGYRWVLSRAVAVRDAYGRATRLAGSQTDTTKRKRVEKQLLYDALHDPLTGLPNRTYFMAQLESARQASRRSPETFFGLLFLDVDRFKVVNDSLGHFVGDQLLVSIAERLKACVRPGDTICRLGGDEFAVLVENLDEVKDATYVAERIQRNLERPLEAGAQDVYAAVSIGIALSAGGRESPEDLLRDADIAMYRAKALGRRRYELFDQRMHTHAVELLQIETDLRRAVERGEMLIYYQPIYSLVEERVTGCEALIRWQHPTRGLLNPHQFISVAEETGVINDIGAWLLDQTCRQSAEWRAAGLTAPRISVNVSPRQLMGQDLQQLVLDALRNHNLEPDSLQLELTESALMESSDASIRPLEALYKRGVQISLDDFGTGYSSLIYLRRFPIHNIKIDQSFVSRIPADEGDSAIVSGLIALAHSLKLSVIAEGVETWEQVDFLRSQGCDAIQGFVISRPVQAADFPERLRAGLPARDATEPLPSVPNL